MLGLGPARVAGDPAALPQAGECGLAAGQQLVYVGLMAGIKYDPVDRRVEYPVQCDRELYDAKVRPEMAASPGHCCDEQITDLGRQQRQLVRAQLLEVTRTRDGLQQCHLICSLVVAGGAEPDRVYLGGTGNALQRCRIADRYVMANRRRTSVKPVLRPSGLVSLLAW